MQNARPMTTRASIAALLLSCLALSACAGPDVEPDRSGIASGGSALVPSPGLARAIAASLEPRHRGVMPDEPARRRVAEAAAALARGARVELGSVAVLDDGGVVARALPGGHLQVSRGLLARCARAGPRGSLAFAGVLALLVGEVGEGLPEERLAALLRRDGVAGLASSVAPLLAGEAGAERAAEAAGAALRAAEVGPAWRGRAEDAAAKDRAVVSRASTALESVSVRVADALAALGETLGPDAAVLGPYVRVEVSTSGHPEDGGAFARELDLAAVPVEEAREARLDAAEALLRSDDRPGLTQALALADGPGARAAVLRALAQEKGGQPREAERTLRTALVLDPGCHAARMALARLYLAQGRLDAARDEARAALERAPLAVDAHLALGLAEEDPERARARLSIAAALEPDGPDGRRAALALSRRARPPAAPPPPDPDRHRPLGGNR